MTDRFVLYAKSRNDAFDESDLSQLDRTIGLVSFKDNTKKSGH
jgi:hypothetical protein